MNRTCINTPPIHLSRRTALGAVALGASGLMLAAAPSAAAASAARGHRWDVSKSAVRYQYQPRGTEQCSACKLFIAPASAAAPAGCWVVAGEIAPGGWCTLWEPDPAPAGSRPDQPPPDQSPPDQSPAHRPAADRRAARKKPAQPAPAQSEQRP